VYVTTLIAWRIRKQNRKTREIQEPPMDHLGSNPAQQSVVQDDAELTVGASVDMEIRAVVGLQLPAKVAWRGHCQLCHELRLPNHMRFSSPSFRINWW